MRIKFVHEDRLYTPEMTVYYEDFDDPEDYVIRCGDLTLALYFDMFKSAGSNFHVIIRSHKTGREHTVHCHSIDLAHDFVDMVRSYVDI